MAILTAVTINANRSSESKSPPARARNFYHFAPVDEIGITKKAARALFDLADTGDLPMWALNQIHNNLDEFEKADDKTIPVPELRAYKGEGFLALAPMITGDWLEADVIIWDNPEQYVEIWNIDDCPKGTSQHFVPDEKIIVESEVKETFTGYTLGNTLKLPQLIENG